MVEGGPNSFEVPDRHLSFPPTDHRAGAALTGSADEDGVVGWDKAPQ